MAISVRSARHSIGFHPPRIGHLVDDCRHWQSGRFFHLPASATVRATCWPVRDGSLLWGIADHLLAFDLGCEGAAIYRAGLLNEGSLHDWVSLVERDAGQHSG